MTRCELPSLDDGRVAMVELGFATWNLQGVMRGHIGEVKKLRGDGERERGE